MTDIKIRKKAHVEITASGRAAYDFSTGLDEIRFRHEALPELNFSEISTHANLLGRTFTMPLFISSMTGGYSGATAVNTIIAETCERWNIPFGVGSQRAMLVDPSQTESFSIVRKVAPTAFIAGNIGGCQLIKEYGFDEIKRLTDSIEANALIIHLNPLQELMQPEGDTDFKGILNQIEQICLTMNIPIIVKETGAGIHYKTAKQLVNVGVKVIDIAASGGTSWAKVENLRKESNEQESVFNNWGIPLVECLMSYQGRNRNDFELIASGGIKNGLETAKCLALGADFTATAQPVIKSIVEKGEEGIELLLQKWQKEIKTTQLLCGYRTLNEFGFDSIL